MPEQNKVNAILGELSESENLPLVITNDCHYLNKKDAFSQNALMAIRQRKKLDALIYDIHRLAGTEFNINSTQQLANILFDILELPQIKKRSTAEIVLQQLKNHHVRRIYIKKI